MDARDRGALRVGLVGAGAVGVGLGTCLVDGGAELTVLARPAAAEALAREGLGRTGLFGSSRCAPGRFRVSADPDTWKDQDLHAVLVCTKAFSAEAVARRLAGLGFGEPGAARPAILVCHNGWGSAQVFAAHLPPEQVFSARIITGFRRIDPTTSEITVHAEPVAVGSLFGGDPTGIAPVVEALARGGLPCEWRDEVARDLWAKMLYNCALNPLGALCGVPYGALAQRDSTRALLEASVVETFAAMEAEGYRTHWPDPGAYLRDFYERLLPPTASHESSMLQDLRAGRRTEIDALCGAVAELAGRHGLRAPVSGALSVLVRGIEARAGARRS